MSEFHDVWMEAMAEIADRDPSECAEGLIHDDGYADWAILKIKEEESERDRLLKTVDEKLEYYKALRAGIVEKCEKRTGNLKYHLMQYFKTVPHKKLKASENYSLPSGKLSVKYGKVKQKFIDSDGNEDKKGAKLVEWLESNGYAEYVRISKEPAWAVLKDVLSVSGDGWCMTATGEEVEGIQAYRTDDEFEVK